MLRNFDELINDFSGGFVELSDGIMAPVVLGDGCFRADNAGVAAAVTKIQLLLRVHRGGPGEGQSRGVPPLHEPSCVLELPPYPNPLQRAVDSKATQRESGIYSWKV